MALVPVYNEWFEDKTSLLSMSARRVWECPTSEAMQQIESLYYQPLDGAVGLAPRATRVYSDHATAPENFTRIIAEYTPPSVGGGYVRTVSKARVRFADVTDWDEVTWDLDGKRVYGPDPDDPRLIWRPAFKGGILKPYGTRCAVVVETAYEASTFSFGTVLDLKGSVNGSTVSLLGAGQDTLLFIGAQDGKWTLGDDLVYVDYHFLYDREGWNASAKVITDAWVPQRVPVLDTDGEVVTVGGSVKYTTHMVLAPKSKWVTNGDSYSLVESAAEDRRPYEEAEFSMLQGQTLW